MTADVTKEAERYHTEAKDYIAKIRTLHFSKNSPTFRDACKKLGIHEAELQLKYE